MFLINIHLRIALMAGTILGGIALWAIYGTWYGLPFILIGLTLLIGFFLLGTVQSSAQLLQNQDFAGAEKRLNMTIKPNWLYGPIRSTFYILKSSFASQRKDFAEAENWLNLAKDQPMNSDDERAMVLVQLAGIEANKQRWPAVQRYLKELNALNIKEPMIKQQVEDFNKAFKNRGIMKKAGQMKGGFRQPGGKKRRPKMR